MARPSGPSVFLWLAPGPPPNRPPSMGPWLLGIAGGGSNQGDCGSCVYDPMLHGIIADLGDRLRAGPTYGALPGAVQASDVALVLRLLILRLWV